MRPSTVRWIAIALVAALVVGLGALAALQGPTASPGETSPDSAGVDAPDRAPFVVAHAAGPAVAVFDRPRSRTPDRVLRHPTENGGPLVFLVEEERGPWLRVLLPVRPNGSVGWIRARDVRLYHHDYRMVVDLGARRLQAHRGDRVILDAPVAIGTRDTPTPGGRYYVKELLRPPDPDTVYGTYAYGLSGFSNVLTRFRGGDGVIGIHGTNDPSVIGQEVSAGCIRLRNEDIERLVPVLPLGTPVEIVA